MDKPIENAEVSLSGKKSASSLRRSRALQIVFGEEPIIHVGGPIWDVPSETKCQRYSVNIDRLTCECKFFRDRRTVCKHMEAVRIFRSKNDLKPDAEAPLKFPNPYKNPPWYDRLAAEQFNVLMPMLSSLGQALNAKAAANA